MNQLLRHQVNNIFRTNTLFFVLVSSMFFGFAFFLSNISFVYASTTTGTISTTHKFAWGSVAGYVNFAPLKSVITVTDSKLSGYAWSTNDGWINLSPVNGGVKNNGNGVLSGFAWDESAGWVDFTGVTINSSGVFHGTATGGTVSGANYSINFDCSSCSVQTDWRPLASRAPVQGAIGVTFTNISPRTTSPKPTVPSQNKYSTSTILNNFNKTPIYRVGNTNVSTSSKGISKKSPYYSFGKIDTGSNKIQTSNGSDDSFASAVISSSTIKYLSTNAIVHNVLISISIFSVILFAFLFFRFFF